MNYQVIAKDDIGKIHYEITCANFLDALECQKKIQKAVEDTARINKDLGFTEDPVTNYLITEVQL